MSKIDLSKDKIIKIFISYLIPSVAATAITSCYILTDTIMIGQGIGANALIALNLLLPLFSVFFGFGYLFGVGGAVLMSVANGKGDREEAKKDFSTALISLLIIGITFTLVLSLNLEKVAVALGATADNIDLVMEYGQYLCGSAFIYMLPPFFQNFVRNDKGPKCAMLGSLVGSICNIIFDYIFIYIWNMGMTGAILATMIGNILSVLIMLTHFISKENTITFSFKAFRINELFKIIKNGASSFLLETAGGIGTFAFNIVILKYIGQNGIIVYGVISNILIVATAMTNGVANATQPIVAHNFGAGLSNRVKSLKRLGTITSFLVCVIFYIIIYALPKQCIDMFVDGNAEIYSLGLGAIRKYFLVLIFMGFNIFYSNYFQAVVKAQYSFLISVLRGLVLNVGLIIILPKILGVEIIWYVMPIVEAICFVITICLVNTDSTKQILEN